LTHSDENKLVALRMIHTVLHIPRQKTCSIYKKSVFLVCKMDRFLDRFECHALQDLKRNGADKTELTRQL